MLDPADPRHARALRRLAAEPVIWLTTVRPNGQAQTSPVWYLFEDGGFLALHRKCTHLGCTVSWLPDERRFACPCHASAFSVQGRVLSAPAPRPLDRFPVSVNGGIVFVDTTRRVRQDPDLSRHGVAAS